ncbi:6,7-dimethyl-8-ribityllumazine synthase [Candidatus Hodgkinia cicadicola]|nr:6,7-dimethyl-8-ribityllumazine synthase [Candidatus Hodgkinia cicadicola]
MLFLIRDIRILILVSCCHVYLADLVLKRLKARLSAQNIAFVVMWFFGVYDLNWVLDSSFSHYSGYIVLGFVLKGVSSHNIYITMSVFNSILRYPVVNAVCSLDYVELAWKKAFDLNVFELITSLRVLLGISFGLLLNY